MLKMILSQFFSTGSSSATSSSSADVYAKVSKFMQAQNTGAPKLNAALASDNTTLSGLGKLLNALTSFQSVAQSLSGGGLNTSASSSGAATPVVAQDSAQLTKNVTNLVNTYNSLNASLKGLQQGDLKAEGSVSRIQNQLARVLSLGSNGTAGASYLSLGSIGISTQKNGDLAIDATKLQNAINTNPDGVAKLFTNNGRGIADNLVRQIQGLAGPTGSIPRETATINKDISALTVKKNNLAKALTDEANALVKQYSQQAQASSSIATGLTSSSQSSGNSTLFDMLG
jgi:flagellar hook-associated protein 2